MIQEKGLSNLITKCNNSTVFSMLQMLLGIKTKLWDAVHSRICGYLEVRDLDSQEQVAHLLNQWSLTNSKLVIRKYFEYDLTHNGPTLFESYQRVENIFLEAGLCYQVRDCFYNASDMAYIHTKGEKEKIDSNRAQFLSKLPFLDDDYSYPAPYRPHHLSALEL
ncbi:MAG: hypothetical protein QRY74_03300 [Chlamydia sp.]